MVTLWDWELKHKILNKHFENKVYAAELGDDLLKPKINEGIFSFVSVFILVLQSILDNVPVKNDSIYLEELYKGLFECVLTVMERVVQALDCQPSKLCQDQLSNKLLFCLFKDTHSDEAYRIFKRITYNTLKWEGYYKEVCLEASVDPVGFKEGYSKWLVNLDSKHEESKSTTTTGIKPDESERLKNL